MPFDKHAAWIQTATNRHFSLAQPRAEDVCIYDIASALSKLCRFNGHCFEFYSVAQHSVHVAQLVDPPYKMDALCHDAGEAYYGDITRPQKLLYREITTQENRFGRRIAFDVFTQRIDRAIAMALKLSLTMPDCIHHADNVMLATEARDLMGPPPEPWVTLPPPREKAIVPLEPRLAYHLFMGMYEELKANRENQL